MNFEQVVSRVQRAMLLDDAAIVSVRDDAGFTAVSLGAAALAALISGFGAFLYGEVVLSATPDGWFMDTVVLGTLFTIILFCAGIALIYLMLTQVYRLDVAPDALVRVVALMHIPYALGFFVFLQEVGFGFGVLSVLGTFFYTFYALRTAVPQARPLRLAISILVGFSLWIFLIPVISDQPADNFVTGVFVYSLIA